MTASKTNTLRAHPRGPKPKSRVSHFRKSTKLFFSMDQTFLFWWPNFFLWGCFFLFLEGFSLFYLSFPTPIQKIINVTAPELHHHIGGPRGQTPTGQEKHVFQLQLVFFSSKVSTIDRGLCPRTPAGGTPPGPPEVYGSYCFKNPRRRSFLAFSRA